MEHLAEVTGWKRDVVSSALYYDVKQVGLGVERKGGKLFLILPEGVKVLPVKDKTTSRAEALAATAICRPRRDPRLVRSSSHRNQKPGLAPGFAHSGDPLWPSSTSSPSPSPSSSLSPSG